MEETSFSSVLLSMIKRAQKQKGGKDEPGISDRPDQGLVE